MKFLSNYIGGYMILLKHNKSSIFQGNKCQHNNSQKTKKVS
ncbi:hypothetical protein B0I63_003345 [Clostridium beijerinckii]|nr:hypothetical protein CLBIJ_31680 [Clostridium beijerinckii]MBA9014679.1 hypothetical protein [Clostridium beijerinckii]NRT05270.1 hypothetical protein [Clostridium beijerinckii]NRT28934.1 hypothetical protein [Clostridium beijerinckii]NRT41063.1 hypothetical protein [Clostridium beijerinckii]